MTDSDLIFLLFVFAGGLFSGVLLTLLFNKLRSGSASPASVKREMEEYQSQVEAHFDETSDKFKAMAEQYKDLYQHLSVGATTLCRPEHVVPGFTDESDPLKAATKKLGAQPGKTGAKTAEQPQEKSAEGKSIRQAGNKESSSLAKEAPPANDNKPSAKGSKPAAQGKGQGESSAKPAPAAKQTKQSSSASGKGENKAGKSKDKAAPSDKSEAAKK